MFEGEEWERLRITFFFLFFSLWVWLFGGGSGRLEEWVPVLIILEAGAAMILVFLTDIFE